MQRLISIIVFIMPFCSCNSRAEYITLGGLALGTSYKVVYSPPADFSMSHESYPDIPAMVLQAINDIDSSLSVYNSTSIISKVNRNEPVEVDTLFIQVFERATEIYHLTDGAFDMAAAPFFDLWGFGYKAREQVTQEALDSIAQFAGMDKIWLSNGKIEKVDPRVSLNANAIAKGYCSDLIARRLKSVGVKNLMVEVGGEIYCEGKNPQRKKWRIGIDRPELGNFIPGMSLSSTLLISGKGIATSGNYRNYYEEDGQIIGHTIDPSSGKPVQHSLLSATVIASDCMSADALATSFMVMGVEKTQQFLYNHPEIDAYLIYKNAAGSLQSFATKNVKFYQ